MNQEQIEHSFRKVNSKLMGELNEEETRQAMSQFKKLYQQQMSKVSLKLLKRYRVRQNLTEQEQNEHNIALKIEKKIKDEMMNHLKKRQSCQVQRLKLYKNGEYNWQQRIKYISQLNNNQKKKDYQRSKKLNQEIQLFWLKRNQKQSVRHQLSRYSSGQSVERKKSNENIKFITELDNFDNNQKSKQQSRNLPHIKYKFRTEGTGSKSVGGKDKNEDIKQHLVKSHHKWQEKQEVAFQNAMKKIQKILQSRKMVKEKMNKEIMMSKQSRIFKQQKLREGKRYQSTNRQIDKKAIDKRSMSIQTKERFQTFHPEKWKQNSQIQIRKREVLQSETKRRQNIFIVERKKQKRGNFHQMVKATVNILKLQALKNKG